MVTEYSNARQVRAKLGEYNLTRVEFARRAGISQAYLTDILNGHRGMGAVVRDKIAHAIAVLEASPPPDYRPPRPRLRARQAARPVECKRMTKMAPQVPATSTT